MLFSITLAPYAMNLKSEKSIKEYLKSLSDDVIIRYYLDMEFSPFPVLVMEEYTRRFKQKTKDEIIRNIKNQEKIVERKVRELKRFAKKQRLIDEVKIKKSEDFLRDAKKKGHSISDTILRKSGIFGSKIKDRASSGIKEGIKTSRTIGSTTEKNLIILEKLGDLRKAGIISEKEFREKKKKILAKIK